MFDGYKTYTFAALIFVSALMYEFGWINAKTLKVLVDVFIAGGLYGVRDAVKKGFTALGRKR